jgi:hypothetical protein
MVAAVKFAKDSREDEHGHVPQQLTAVGYLDTLAFHEDDGWALLILHT